ncbi:hypothetical protein PFWH6_0121 [Pseudomonas fluorescens WH6]|nr:hypothetical protein PFWH6_0121 [Pseudomonas fluorescens WH6]
MNIDRQKCRKSTTARQTAENQCVGRQSDVLKRLQAETVPV